MQKLLTLALFLSTLGLAGCNESKDTHEDYSPLTKQEIQKVNDYVDKVTPEEGIGQLFMVGVPADLNTAEDINNKSLDELIGARAVGMVIVNGFNYYDNSKTSDDMEYLTRIIHFNNLLQLKTSKSRLKLPLLVAVDFEGPNNPSIKRGLVLPPSALSLSTSQDGPLIRAMGRYVGTELTSVGIQVILGPVLDTYNIRQGTKNILQDRCFAANSEGVARTASHYIAGLNESGIASFAKHYPSYGSIETDPHQAIVPVYEGSREQMNAELKPFIQSKSSISGIMTSHILLANAKDSGIATFSHELIGTLQQHALDNKIAITDDLADMGAIRSYMSENRKTYQDIAVDAFDAGHDVLLFAHISDEKKSGEKHSKNYKASSFTLNDLHLIQERLVTHIVSSDSAMTHFRVALKKVMLLKAKISRINSPTEPIDRLLSRKQGSDSAFNFQVKTDARTAIDNTERSMGIAISDKDVYPSLFNDTSIDGSIGNKIVKDSIRKSVIWINKSKKDVDLNISGYPNSRKIIFAVYDDHLAKFEEAFSSHFTSAYFFGIPIRKDSDSFQKLERSLNLTLPRADLLIYTAHDGSDIDLLKRLRHKYPQAFPSKILIFCHNSPAIFDNSMISDSSFVGNFSMHPASFEIDIEILKGAITPKGLDNIPINIGDNAKFFDVSSTKWIEPANPISFEAVYDREMSSAARRNFESQYYLLIPKNSFLSLLMKVLVNTTFILVLAAACAMIYLIPKHLANDAKHAGKTHITILSHGLFGKVISIVIFVLCLFFIYFNEYPSALANNAASFFSKVKEIK